MKTFRICLVLTVLTVFSLLAAPVFAATDNVLSANIKEADGSTGQDTNNGSGVKTGHIQDGAVTDAKISGVISGSKIGLHTHSQSQVNDLEAALAGKSDVTHYHDALYQQKYGKVAVVAQTGGDYTDPLSAMDNLSSWCGTPAASNPCLLKIMPGVYNIGESTLQMREYVDVEGSGRDVTVISGNGKPDYVTRGLIEGNSNAELRMLTVKTAGGAFAIGVGYGSMGTPGAEFKLSDAVVIVSGGIQNYGVSGNSSRAMVIENTKIVIADANIGTGVSAGGKLRMTNVSISVFGAPSAYQLLGIASGYNAVVEMDHIRIAVGSAAVSIGIRTEAADEKWIDVSVDVQGVAVHLNPEGSVKAEHCSFKGTDLSIRNYGTAKFALTYLNGSIQNNHSMKLFGCYDGNFNAIPNQ